jgi:hypothetical protein
MLLPVTGRIGLQTFHRELDQFYRGPCQAAGRSLDADMRRSLAGNTRASFFTLSFPGR